MSHYQYYVNGKGFYSYFDAVDYSEMLLASTNHYYLVFTHDEVLSMEAV